MGKVNGGGEVSGPIFHHDIKQLSPAWSAIRTGIPTSSEMHRIITHEGKASTQAGAYMNRLLWEWVSGKPVESDYESPYMALGKENEQSAVDAFTFQTGLAVEKIGFVTRADGMVGSSPDRIIPSRKRTLEIKCPAGQTQIGYLLHGVPLNDDLAGILEASLEAMAKPRTKVADRTPEQDRAAVMHSLMKQLAHPDSVTDDHFVQIQSQLSVLEWEAGYVCTYHPDLPPVVTATFRDEPFICKMEALVDAFVDVMLQRRSYLEREFGPFTRPQPKVNALESEFGVSEADVEHLMKEKGF